MQQRLVLALYDVSTEDAGELSFAEGELLVAVDDGDGEWFRGVRLAELLSTGISSSAKLFPKSYVEELSTVVEERTAEFPQQDSQEPGELAFAEGERLSIYHVVDDNWVVGRNGRGEFGLIPVNYLAAKEEERANHVNASMASINSSTITDARKCRVVRQYKAEQSDELSVKVGDTVFLFDESDPHWAIVELINNGREKQVGMIPKNCIIEDAADEITDDSVQEAHSVPIPPPPPVEVKQDIANAQSNEQPASAVTKKEEPKTATPKQDFLSELRSKAERENRVVAPIVVNEMKIPAKAEEPRKQETVVVPSKSAEKMNAATSKPLPKLPSIENIPKPQAQRQHSSSSNIANQPSKPQDIVKPTPKPEAPKFRLPEVKLKAPGEKTIIPETPKPVERKPDPPAVPEPVKPAQRPSRIWSSRTGTSQQEASYAGLSQDAKMVKLGKPDGKIIQVALDALSERDVVYVNGQEGRQVYTFVSPESAKKAGKESSPAAPKIDPNQYVVRGFNWFTFLSNNTALKEPAVAKYADLFCKSSIGEREMLELDSKRIALMGVKVLDCEEVMGAINKMKALFKKSDKERKKHNKQEGGVKKKMESMSISDDASSDVGSFGSAGKKSVSSATSNTTTKTTIMIPQFAVESGQSISTGPGTTVTVRKTVDPPTLSKIIDPPQETHVYSLNRNQPQPNTLYADSLAPRPTSPGILHRNSIPQHYPPQSMPPQPAYPYNAPLQQHSYSHQPYQGGIQPPFGNQMPQPQMYNPPPQHPAPQQAYYPPPMQQQMPQYQPQGAPGYYQQPPPQGVPQQQQQQPYGYPPPPQQQQQQHPNYYNYPPHH